MSSFFKRILTSAEAFLFGLSTIVVYYYFPRLEIFADSDEAWHITAGFLIRRLGYIPEFDPWSFASDQRWYNVSWAWDVICSYIYQIFGDNFIFINALLYGALMVYIYRTLKIIPKLKEDTINIVTALAGIVLIISCLFRPHLAAYFLSVYCIRLFALNKSFTNNFIMKFILLIIVWVNFHGSVLIPFSVLGAHFITAAYNKNFYIAKRLALCGIISLISTLLNPIGYNYYVGILRTLDSVITTKIIEWQPFIFGINYGFSVAIIIMIFVNNLKSRNISLSNKIITYSWLFAALSSIRYMPFFMILSLEFFAKSIDVLIKPSLKTVFKPHTYLPTLLICFGCLHYHHTLLSYENKAYSVPKAEIEFLAKHYPGIKVLTNYLQGGFVIFYGNGKIKNFIDPRAGTVYSEEVLNKYLTFESKSDGWEEILSYYDIQAVILPRKDFYDHSYDKVFKNWSPLHLSLYGVIYIRPDIYHPL